ncbi:hypothetical protein [Streptomyces sp. NPDC020597]|uniref:hypothetical protein n=1 Tax=unclassified Streptomyces TaxID=2593676 RepID=UPI0037AA46D6
MPAGHVDDPRLERTTPGQMCELDASPRTATSGFSWRDARFAEYRNHGPRATVTADRPQLGDADAKAYTVTACLEGADGWAPHRRTTH